MWQAPSRTVWLQPLLLFARQMQLLWRLGSVKPQGWTYQPWLRHLLLHLSVRLSSMSRLSQMLLHLSRRRRLLACWPSLHCLRGSSSRRWHQLLLFSCNVPTAEVRSVLNAASGATFGQAGMLPLVELMPHYSFILPKRKLSSSVMGNILGMAESGALVASPSKEVAFLSAVDKSLKAADRPGLMKAQVPVMMESMSVLDRAHTVKILRGLAKDNREYVLQLLNASPSSRFAELLSWLFPCTPESGGAMIQVHQPWRKHAGISFILAGIGKPIGVDELFPANFLPGDIKSDYFKPMTLNSQIHSADSAAVTALVCGAEARIVEPCTSQEVCHCHSRLRSSGLSNFQEDSWCDQQQE